MAVVVDTPKTPYTKKSTHFASATGLLAMHTAHCIFNKPTAKRLCSAVVVCGRRWWFVVGGGGLQPWHPALLGFTKPILAAGIQSTEARRRWRAEVDQ